MIESIDLVLDQYVSSKYVDEMLESDWKNDGVEVVKTHTGICSKVCVYTGANLLYGK